MTLRGKICPISYEIQKPSHNIHDRHLIPSSQAVEFIFMQTSITRYTEHSTTTFQCAWGALELLAFQSQQLGQW